MVEDNERRECPLPRMLSCLCAGQLLSITENIMLVSKPRQEDQWA